MKKIVLLISMAMLFLTGCNADLKVTPLAPDALPKDVAKLIETNDIAPGISVQNHSVKTKYLFIHTTDDIKDISLEAKDNHLYVHITGTENPANDLQLHVYKLKIDKQYEYFEAIYNDESTAFATIFS